MDLCVFRFLLFYDGCGFIVLGVGLLLYCVD